ncbi:54S ribosomal protein L17 mitochondrial [Mactra antiquata]
MIRFPLKSKPRKFKYVLTGCGSGPQERVDFLKKMVTSLIRHERIEGRADKMHETRAYAEQLINLAIQHGDRHEPTMKMADEWLLEKDLVHKLFKVLAPRYQQYATAFTSVHLLPAEYPGQGRFKAVLELKGNPYPDIIPRERETRYLLTNILLSAAGRDFYAEQNRLQELNTKSETVVKDSQEVNTSYENNVSEISIKDNVKVASSTDNFKESDQTSVSK